MSVPSQTLIRVIRTWLTQDEGLEVKVEGGLSDARHRSVLLVRPAT